MVLHRLLPEHLSLVAVAVAVVAAQLEQAVQAAVELDRFLQVHQMAQLEQQTQAVAVAVEPLAAMCRAQVAQAEVASSSSVIQAVLLI
jgi:formamidopyrimidine-DNA glycosylase